MVVPDYGGACVSGVVPALLGRHRGSPPWLPPGLAGADQVVVLVLDGLGWLQLQERRTLAPTLAAMAGGPITTVAPSTTATALTSLSTGMAPAEHGLMGYRMRVHSGQVLNVLRWTTASGDARRTVAPEALQAAAPFGGTRPPVVTKADFQATGFSAAHLAGVRMCGWRTVSTIAVHVRRLLAAGEPFVYAYYPGIDTVAHEYGFGPFFDAEVTAADHLVADLVATLPSGAALAVVADHGQVDVGERVLSLPPDLVRLTKLLSGEGRFRWLHARPGAAERLRVLAEERFGEVAWVRTRDEAAAEGWFGGPLAPEVAARLGDVVLAARDPVAFDDPADTGPMALVCRHGSLTAEEMLVPLLVATG